MFKRLLQPPQHSFFLFGPRGTGKTSLLKEHLPQAYVIDLLQPNTFHDLVLEPQKLIPMLEAYAPVDRWVVIDEVQKIPILLDIVHQQIESSTRRFALTGSSARKLRHGAANLLAGRAFVYYLFPLTTRELGAKFSLDSALRWGTLPKLFALASDEERQDFLRSYAHTYLQEEITQEQLVRRLEPFRRFLGVAAQMNGQVLNYSKIAKDVGASVPTVQSYFQILEDTLVGFLLEPFHESIRKRQRENPKFYFFDTGVQRALAGFLRLELLPQTYAYGATFEHFLLTEIIRLAAYGKRDFRFSYLRTKDDVEIDLIIERPGMPRALVELKSTSRISEEDVRALRRLKPDIPNSEAFCLSLDPLPRSLEGVRCLPWQQGLTEIGL